MARAMKVCSTPGCAEIVKTGRCTGCDANAERARGTAAERGYTRGHQTFRAAVLRRDPICVIPDCYLPSKHADHHPRDRRELVALGLNPNDPQYGRGLCHGHHSKHTSEAQPGGWNAR